MYEGESTIIRKAFERKYSSISVLEVEAVPPELYSISPDWFEFCFMYGKFIACGEF
jgi:hypothetical protein